MRYEGRSLFGGLTGTNTALGMKNVQGRKAAQKATRAKDSKTKNGMQNAEKQSFSVQVDTSSSHLARSSRRQSPFASSQNTITLTTRDHVNHGGATGSSTGEESAARIDIDSPSRDNENLAMKTRSSPATNLQKVSENIASSLLSYKKPLSLKEKGSVKSNVSSKNTKGRSADSETDHVTVSKGSTTGKGDKSTRSGSEKQGTSAGPESRTSTSIQNVWFDFWSTIQDTSMKALTTLIGLAKWILWPILRALFKCSIWFLNILIVAWGILFLLCEGYIYLFGAERSGLDLTFSLACSLPGTRTVCKAVLCQSPNIERLLPTVCPIIDESENITQTFQETYGLLAQMAGSKEVMHLIPAQLTTHRMNFGYQIERFKIVMYDLAISSHDKDETLELQDHIYTILTVMPDFLTRFYGRIDSVVSIVHFETSVTQDAIDEILNNNSTMLVNQTLRQSEKDLNERCLDHAQTWRKDIEFLLTPGQVIATDLLQLEKKINSYKSHLETARQRTVHKRLQIVQKWPYGTRVTRWLLRKSIISWLSESEETRAYSEALNVCDDLSTEIQHFQPLFGSLLNQIRDINGGLMNLVIKLKLGTFRLEPGERGLTRLRNFYEDLDSFAEHVHAAVRQNQTPRIESSKHRSAIKDGISEDSG